MLWWICVYKYLFKIPISILLVKYLEVEFLDHMVILFFNGLRNLHTVFCGSCMILYPHQQCAGFIFSTSSSILIILFSPYNCHPKRCEMVSHCGLDLHFPDNWCCYFSFTCWSFICFLRGNVYSQCSIYIQWNTVQP